MCCCLTLTLFLLTWRRQGIYGKIFQIVDYICVFQPPDKSVQQSNIFVVPLISTAHLAAGGMYGTRQELLGSLRRRKRYVVAVSATRQSKKLQPTFTYNYYVFFNSEWTYCRHISNHRRKTGLLLYCKNTNGIQNCAIKHAHKIRVFHALSNAKPERKLCLVARKSLFVKETTLCEGPMTFPYQVNIPYRCLLSLTHSFVPIRQVSIAAVVYTVGQVGHSLSWNSSSCCFALISKMKCVSTVSFHLDMCLYIYKKGTITHGACTHRRCLLKVRKLRLTFAGIVFFYIESPVPNIKLNILFMA